MGDVAKIQEKQKTGLELIRTPFPEHQIGNLPKPTRAQTEALKKDIKAGRRCTICGGWHLPDVVHLDYVGHAAITDRLLDVDLLWQWEPFAVSPETGLPVIDAFGGMWIRLTVCGHTRIGYGHADGKTGPDAIKETIGDAIRNAAMRFGAALELWHKGELHKPAPQDEPEEPMVISDETAAAIKKRLQATSSDVKKFCEFLKIPSIDEMPTELLAKAEVMLAAKEKANANN